MRAFSASFVAVLCAAGAAQEPRWSLPERGALLYARQSHHDSRAAPQGAPATQPWPGPAPAPVLLTSEFDSKQKAWTAPVHDLRLVLPSLCFNLGLPRGGKGSLQVESDFVRASVAVTYGPMDAQGKQTLEASVEPPEPKVDPAAYFHRPRVRGTLRAERIYDRASMRVTSWSGTLDLDSEFFDTPRKVHVRLEESWAFERALTPDDPTFPAMVAEAIRRAADALERSLQARVNAKAGPEADPYHDALPGELALQLLALIKGGADPQMRLVEGAYDDLRRRNIEGTYSLGAAILAIEALYTPPGEWEGMRAGTITAPLPRQLPERDRALVQEWADKLLDNIDGTTDKAYLRRFHYGPSSSWDNSTTQYALLGLYAASLCGVEISPTVWTASASHLLTSRISGGKEAVPQLLSHADRQKIEAGKKATSAKGRKAKASGWGYSQGHEATGSMTTAGISGLSLCAAALRAQKKGGKKLLAEIDEAVAAGFLWLERGLSVRGNPGPTHGEPG